LGCTNSRSRAAFALERNDQINTQVLTACEVAADGDAVSPGLVGANGKPATLGSRSITSARSRSDMGSDFGMAGHV
jgi:hypothetical protein